MEAMELFTESYIRQVRGYWEQYVLENKPLPAELPGLRPVILESWRRSRVFFVDQSSTDFAILSREELADILAANRELIEVSHSYLEHLSAFIRGTNFVIALTDGNGCVIDIVVEDSGIKGLMNRTNLRIGSVRNEQITGTSGIATCLATDTPFQILGEEHYVQHHHTYFCSAAPIHDAAGALIGCLAMIGPREMTHTHTFGMVCTAVDGIQKELRMRQANSRLSFVNAQLQNMIQSLSSGVMLLDEDKRVVRYNELARSILGLPEGLPLDGRYMGELFSLSAIPDGVWDTPASNMEITLTTHEGRSVDVVYNSVITRSEDGHGQNITFIFQEQQRVRQLVRKMSGYTAQYTFDSIIGRSARIQAVKEMGRTAARSTSNVLILGESGTGKELLAQSIHNAGERASGPFIAVNCGSIPKNLIESELFGYESGSFTGAKREGNPGKFELADGGTLFLDEIGDMPLELQASLLRVLQNHEVVRIGGKHAKFVDVKVIAATNADLTESVRNGRFRKDLYYRLNVLSILVPPLRERTEDIPMLTAYFIDTYNRALRKHITHVDPAVSGTLERYDWPGNIRELENVIERATNLVRGDTLKLSDLPPELLAGGHPELSPPLSPPEPSAVGEAQPCSPEIQERDAILAAMTREKGHIKSVAAALDMPVRTLYRKLKKYNLHPEQYRAW